MQNVSLALWLLYTAFLARVAGQALVALNLAPWLPSFHNWQSGLMPYSMLFCCQVLILIGFAKVARDITSNNGYFSLRHPVLGRRLRRFALIYLVIMSLRFVICQFFLPTLASFAPLIPTIFHIVLGTFLLIVGIYLDRRRITSARRRQETSPIPAS